MQSEEMYSPSLAKEGKGTSERIGDTLFTCPRCGSSKSVENNQSGETVCASCGFVVKNKRFVSRPRLKDSDDGDRKISGMGSPETFTLHDKGLLTEVSPKDMDGRGDPLSPKEKALARKLRGQQKRCRVSGDGERNLAIALIEIDRMGSQLGIPRDVREVASRIYREAADEGLVVGRSIEGVSSAALYIACRNCELPRTVSEIAELANIEEKETRQAYRALARDLDLNLPPLDATKYISKFGDKLGLSRETRRKALNLVRKVREKGLVSGKSPLITAAAALYIQAQLRTSWRESSGDSVLQKKIEQVIDIPQQTVSERCWEIAREFDFDIGFQSLMLAPIKGRSSSKQKNEDVEDAFGQTPLEGFADNGILGWIPALLDRESKHQREKEDDESETERNEQKNLEEFGR